jgi:hypothetical protein
MKAYANENYQILSFPVSPQKSKHLYPKVKIGKKRLFKNQPGKNRHRTIQVTVLTTLFWNCGNVSDEDSK